MASLLHNLVDGWRRMFVFGGVFDRTPNEELSEIAAQLERLFGRARCHVERERKSTEDSVQFDPPQNWGPASRDAAKFSVLASEHLQRFTEGLARAETHLHEMLAGPAMATSLHSLAGVLKAVVTKDASDRLWVAYTRAVDLELQRLISRQPESLRRRLGQIRADVVQEVMLRCVSRLHDQAHHDASRVESLRDVTQDLLRDRVLRLQAQTADEELREDSSFSADLIVDRVARHEAWGQLRRAISLLPGRSQDLVTLRFFWGLPWSDVAKEIGSGTPDVARLELDLALSELAIAIQQVRATRSDPGDE